MTMSCGGGGQKFGHRFIFIFIFSSQEDSCRARSYGCQKLSGRGEKYIKEDQTRPEYTRPDQTKKERQKTVKPRGDKPRGYEPRGDEPMGDKPT